MGLSTLAGHRVTSAHVTMPAWGLWFADVAIDGEHTLTGTVTLQIADLVLRGTVIAGGPMKGRSSYRIVAGAGGWGREIPAKGYTTDAGVKVSTVIADAAKEVGETLAISTDARTGPAFSRDEGRASLVLESLAPSAWYVDEQGVTRLGRRPASILAAAVPRVSPVDLARGTVTFAPTSLAALVPGITIDGIEAVDVIHDVTPEGIRTTIYGARGANTSRRLSAWRKLFEQLDPDRDYRALWEYRVVLQSGSRLDLQPVLASTGMPTLRRVPMRPGVSGCKSDVALGSYVLVGFVNASRGRPVVLGFADAESEGFKPLLTEIDAQTLVRLGEGVRPAIAAGDLAGGIWPCAPTQTKVVI